MQKQILGYYLGYCAPLSLQIVTPVVSLPINITFCYSSEYDKIYLRYIPLGGDFSAMDDDILSNSQNNISQKPQHSLELLIVNPARSDY